MHELTNSELDSVIDTAKESRENSVDMAKYQDEVQINPDAELEEDVDFIDADIENIGDNTSEPSNINILNIESASASEATRTVVKNNFNLSDEDSFKIFDIIKNLKTPGYSVYNNLPDDLKKIIDDVLKKNNVATTISNREMYARNVMDEIIRDSGIEQTFIDLEEALDEALNIPSIVDLYSEHTREVMEEKIPEMIEKIKDTEPENAQKLADIKEAFTKSYTFSRAIEGFNASFIRKAIRRYELEFRNSLRNFNYKNRESTFKMCDALEMPTVLKNILIDEPIRIYNGYTEIGKRVPEVISRLIELKISEVDIQKFCILITKTAMSLDASNIIDASYMYYLIKNIVVLKASNEAKTSFAIELINNICNVIVYIRDEEAKYESTNIHKSKHGKKLRK